MVHEMSFKDISYLQLWLLFCSAEQKDLCKFGRGQYEEHFIENILNWDQWFKRCCLKIILIYSSCAALFIAEHLCNFGRRLYGEHYCEIILI